MPKQNQTHKLCPSCKEFLPKEKFSKHRNRHDGLQSNCKCCLKKKQYSWLKTSEGATKREKWVEENHKMLLDYGKSYRKNNRETISAKEKERKNADPNFKAIKQMRSIVHASLKRGLEGNIKHSSTNEMIGCTPVEFIKHIESLFQPGMSWDNRAEWEIDHIKPVGLFDMADPSDQKACNHFTNLQPLWIKDHKEKTIRDRKLIDSHRRKSRR